MTSVNGTKPPSPTPVLVVECPVCGTRRRLPEHPPKVWKWRCGSCSSDIEVNLERGT